MDLMVLVKVIWFVISWTEMIAYCNIKSCDQSCCTDGKFVTLKTTKHTGHFVNWWHYPDISTDS